MTGPLRRVPPGVKLAALAAAAIATLVLVTSPAGAGIAALILLAVWLFARVGFRALWVQLWTLRWMILFLLITQLLFLAPLVAMVTTTRILVILLLATLLGLTTTVSELLTAFQWFLRPMRVFGLDGNRVALVLALTITTVPLMTRLVERIREGRAARGARAGVSGYGVPLLVLALQHSDQLGDALDARGA